MARATSAVELPQTDADLRDAFLALATRADVAALLGSTERELIYLLYRDGMEYIEFDVPKRSKGTRHISAPTGSIKILQKRLNQVLLAVYVPKAPVHGFARDRSIVSNADRHVRKKVILNVDLQDFFPSIHFGRVKGVFAAAPYNLPDLVAQDLAQLCCHNSKLPQGAPTSPIVSNMVCVSLDSGLRRLAERHGCTYTRYADDITFSTTRRAFPKQIVAVINDAGPRRALHLGDDLLDVITTNTFRINEAKVRLRMRGERKEVTGLIVHTGVNIPREFIRSVRGMLHAWERYGYDAAEAELRARHHRKHRRPGSPAVSLLAVAAGKIEFIRMVRPSSDLLYTRLWNRFAALAGPAYKSKVALVQARDQIDSALWVVESEDGTVGTAFALENQGLVSCSHCIGEGVVVAYQSSETQKHFRVMVTHQCPHRDLVRLQLDTAPVAALRAGDSTATKKGDLTIAAGFGNYAPGASSRLIRGYITGDGVRSAIPVFYSDHRAFGGHSGGPILNEQLAVIGVLQRAVTPYQPGQETTILPIALLAQVPAVAVANNPNLMTAKTNTHADSAGRPKRKRVWKRKRPKL